MRSKKKSSKEIVRILAGILGGGLALGPHLEKSVPSKDFFCGPYGLKNFDSEENCPSTVPHLKDSERHPSFFWGSPSPIFGEHLQCGVSGLTLPESIQKAFLALIIRTCFLELTPIYISQKEAPTHLVTILFAKKS
jgi:hypothetical protein